jgi:hypothetical protein
MKRQIRLSCGVAVLACACLIPSAAYADAGLPMLALTWPIAIDALVPVILIEAYIFKRRGFPFGWSLKWNAIANIASTLIGIPLAWIAYLAVEMGAAYSLAAWQPKIPWLEGDTLAGKIVGVILTAPWLPPWGDQWPSWIVPAAFLILLVPFFFVSWRFETIIIRGFNRQYDRKSISRTCLRANLASYTLLAIFAVSMIWVDYPSWLFRACRLFWC